ncbi:hypothetical protein GDO86_004776 [Hymenochirus boettgeri]|uniref:Integrase catalytic domain-containing protein n=1 Tax=Hymenochirus boettgeri TaxID=247094 RepID=A0A8T2K911_9PIPI|nr:hypothetical protein GDO86_004776 [Hymenochirus boettgeri]
MILFSQGLQSGHYRKLKVFSGISPVPPGEEGFEAWKYNALQCLKEWSCSDDGKRQRIIESLRSPAAELVHLHRDMHESATAWDFIKILSDHYEPYCDLEQLKADYHMCRQKEGEEVSNFINRLQLSLSRLLYHGAILPREVDAMRKNQLVRGLFHTPLSLDPKLMREVPFGEKWTSTCEKSFLKLKNCLTEAPVLAYADPNKPYILHVDASYGGLGGVLHQQYPTGLRLRTDNNPLTYILNTAKLDATGHRWLAALSNYQFTLKYKPGPKNIGADALSRRPGLPTSTTDEEWEEIHGPSVTALCNTAAVVMGKVLWERFFVNYGLPKCLHSDQGRDFESRLIKELLHLLNVKKSRTTPYHPEGDALPERFNCTLLNMLGTLTVGEKRSWSRHVGAMVHAYNCTRHDSTGVSPYYLMFGREARLPIDLQLGVSTDGVGHRSYYQYVARLKESLQKAYCLAEENAAKTNAGNKRRFDAKIRNLELATRSSLNPETPVFVPQPLREPINQESQGTSRHGSNNDFSPTSEQPGLPHRELRRESLSQSLLNDTLGEPSIVTQSCVFAELINAHARLINLIPVYSSPISFTAMPL